MCLLFRFCSGLVEPMGLAATVPKMGRAERLVKQLFSGLISLGFLALALAGRWVGSTAGFAASRPYGYNRETLMG